MRITLNLASRPFIELRPLYARLRWWVVLLAVVAIPLWLSLRVEERRATEAQAQQVAMTNNLQKLRQEQQRYRAQMQQPANAAVLTQSEFLNQIYKRKAFSWTAVMMDLETVLPAGVQIMNLEPVTAPDGNVTIRMRVSGQRDRAVELVRNLEHSHRFLSPRLAGETAETAGAASQAALQPVSATSGVNFEILADYNPLPRSTTRSRIAGRAASHEQQSTPAMHKGSHRGPRPAAQPLQGGAR